MFNKNLAIVIFWTIIFCLILESCEKKPQLYINNKPYYTETICILSHDTTLTDFHFGWCWYEGDYTWFYGDHTESVCDDYQIDTIEIK